MPLGTEVAPVAPDVDAPLEPTETPAEETPSPAPAEAPVAPAEGEEAPSPETPPASDVPRDAQGRFTKADGTLSEPGEQVAPAAVAEPDLSEYEPFAFRADGQSTTYEGAVQDDDGNVLFTPAAVRQLRQDLAYARAYPRRDADAQRELTRERTRADAADATTKSVLGKLDKMFEDSQGATTLEELLETPAGKWLLNMHADWPKMRADGLQAGFDRRSKALEDENRQLRTRETDAQARPIMLGRIEEAVQHWANEAGLDERGQRALIQRFSGDQWLDQIFPRLTQDDPVTGLKAGQRYGIRGEVDNLEVIREA